MNNSVDSSDQDRGSEGEKKVIVPLKILIIINLIGWGGIIGGLCLFFFDFMAGVLLIFGIGMGLWLFNLTLLIKQKLTKKILLLNLFCGGLMLLASILTQIISPLFIVDRSFLDSFLIMAPFFGGGFLIGDSIRFYRRQTHPPPKKPPTLSPRLSFFGGFISISVFGTAIYIVFIATDPILMVICLLVGFSSIVPLNYILRRYLPSIASEVSKELQEKMKKIISIGLLVVSGLFILIFILFLVEISIPMNILMATLLLFLETFIVLYYILKYFCYPEKLIK